MGRGVKKKRKWAITQAKQSIQPNSNLRKHLVKPKFIDKRLSNFELLEWIHYLRVPNFKCIFSRDSRHHLHETGSCIINLDDEIGLGTHWVATYITGNFIYYFDSFSLPPPQEFVYYAEKLKKKMQISLRSSNTGYKFC